MKLKFAILLLWSALCAPVVAQSDDFAIDWFSVDCGGGTSGDEVYSVSGTAGQPDAGGVGDNVFAVDGGFWVAAIEEPVVTRPTLGFAIVGPNVVISWPASFTGFYLEQNADASQPWGWHAVSQPVVVVNGQNTVTIPLASAMTYYRLTDTPSVLRLMITRVGANVVLSWPAWATGYSLEKNLSANQPNGWSRVQTPVVVSNGLNLVTLPASDALAFFRLTQTPGAAQPRLFLAVSGGNLVISWPASSTGWFLEKTLSVSPAAGWSLVELPVVVSNGMNTVTVPTAGDMAFFRLTRTPGATLPLLTITRLGGNVILSWPAAATGWYLEKNLSATQPRGWSLVEAPVVVSNGMNTVTLPATGDMAYFRLTRVPGGVTLDIVRAGRNVILSWPASASGYYLEQKSQSAATPGGWSLVGYPVVVINGLNFVTVPASGSAAYFRLTRNRTPPTLTIRIFGGNAVITWSAGYVGWYLEQTATPWQSDSWSVVGLSAVVANGLNTVTAPLGDRMIYYRLSNVPHWPSLRVALTSTNTVIVSWPSLATGFSLQQNPLPGFNNWQAVTNAPVIVNDRQQVELPAAGTGALFRLRSQ